MADDSFTYCDSDEELFFGKVSEKEMLKRALLGQNYDSPASTPRPKPKNVPTQIADNLPDVLPSTSKHTANDIVDPPVDIDKSRTSEIDDDIICIDLDNSSQNNSVQIISDDESFMHNEEVLGITYSTNEGVQASICPTKAENLSKLEYGSFFSNQDESMTEVEDENKSLTFERDREMKSVVEDANRQNEDLFSNHTFQSDPALEINRSLATSEDFNCKNTEEIAQCDSLLFSHVQASIRSAKDNNLSKLEYGSFFSNQDESTAEVEGENKSLAFEHDCEMKRVVENAKLGNEDLVANHTFQSEGLKEPDINSSLAASENLYSKNTEEISQCDVLLSRQDFKSIESTSVCNMNHAKSHTNDSVAIENTCSVASQESKVIQDKEDPINKNVNSKTSVEEINLESINEMHGNGSIQSPVYPKNDCLHSKLQDDKDDFSVNMYDKSLPNKSGLSDLDYSSLYAVSDSILNISHGSSLPSPPPVPVSSGTVNIPPTINYEDISCDGEHMFDTASENSNFSKPILENDDLHMSVDEPDFLTSESLDNCTSGTNSYTTALDSKSESCMSQKLCSSFQAYRENVIDSLDIQDIDQVNNFGTDYENEKETSFESIVQNRQNSFIAKTPATKPIENIKEQTKTKMISKLPVFHNSTSLLKPPKLCIKTNALKVDNYKWAKNLQNSNFTETNPNVKKAKLANIETKSPSTYSESKSVKKILQQSNKSENQPLKIKAPIHYLNKVETPANNKVLANIKTPSTSKSPANNKTPARMLQIPQIKLMKSETKTPLSNKTSPTSFTSNEKKTESKNAFQLSKGKERYKHIISPISSYIHGTPTVLLQNAHNTNKETSSSKKNVSHIPKMASKAVQKLDYGNPSGQENVDPNNSRPTLPVRELQAATAVFLKESDQPKRYLPKIGESMQKLLIDTPRPKVIVHQGRVREPPSGQGVLIPNAERGSTGLDSAEQDISIRVVRSAEKRY